MSPRSANGNGAKPEHDRWYKTYRWQQIRKRQLDKHPLCIMCEAEGRTTQATICDHVEPHRGDPHKFWHGQLQSTCKLCHDSSKQRIEKGGKPKPTIGADGWPV